MTTQVISSGATSPAVTSAGDYLVVYSGATALSADVLGGTEVVSGLDSGATLAQHGVQSISSGGTADSTAVSQGATQTIRRGGTAVGATLFSGGSEIVSSGGVARDTLVGSGGSAIVSAGGTSISGTVSSGGTAIIRGDESLSGTNLRPAHASALTVAAGGSATLGAVAVLSGGTVGSGGILVAQSGSTATGLVVQSGGTVIDEPGAVIAASGSGTVITAGVVVLQAASGVIPESPDSTGLVLGSGAQLLVLPGGTATGDSLTDGASLAVFSGGSTTDVVLSGSFETVSGGGYASGTVLDRGSVQYVFSGASAAGTIVDSGFAIVNSGGSATGIVVNDGGASFVDGVVRGTTVGSGGGQYVDLGGTAISTTIAAGGYAFAFGTTTETVAVRAATIAGGYMVISDASARDTTVGSGGTLIAGASTATDTVVQAGGVMLLLSGETDSRTIVDSGGTLIVLPGASVTLADSAVGADIISGGVVALSGGTAVGTYSGTSLSGLAVGSGVTDFVFSGGTVAGATIANRGTLDIAAGGTAIGTTIAGGGVLSLDSGGTATGTITFAGTGGTLVTDVLNLSNTVISGFASGDTIDLPTLTGTAAAWTLTSGNLLEVTNTAGTAYIELGSGQSYGSAVFSASLAQTGGTTVTLAPAASAGAGSVAGNAQPVDIPLYVVPYQDGYKVGIEVSLNGGATYEMYEFDTGASGFFAAYDPATWSSYAAVGPAPVVMSYDSGNTYAGQVVSTAVTLQTSSGTPLTVGKVNVGLIAAAQNPGVFTTQSWNADVTGTTASPPLDGAFYGDFGMAPGDNDGIEAVLDQLAGGLSNGYIITLGDYPDGSTGQIGELQLGLTQADIASFGTVIPMQGQSKLDPFPVSGDPTYTKLVGSGTITVGTFSTPAGFIFDTGAPGMDIHEGTTITAGETGLGPYLDGGSGRILSGTTISATAPGAAGGSGWDLGFVTSGAASQTGLNDASAQAPSTDPATAPGYVNTGLNAFFGKSVMYDLADGLIGFAAPCFAKGTRIATPAGAVAVESLRIGDPLTTVAGEARPIIWIGHRHVDCRRHPAPEAVWPVRVRADAFGPGRPGRDLYLSPDHALFLEGVLIPVKYLIDGRGVAQVNNPRVTYYHVELARHDVILAEGLPAETYLETGCRTAFANGGALVAAHPRFAPEPADRLMVWDALGFAPLAVAGPAVERAKRGLAPPMPPGRRHLA